MLSQLIARIFGRHVFIGKGPARRSQRHSRRRPGRDFDFEPLESRLLLSGDPLALGAMAASLDAIIPTGPSTIIWANRGQASDNFDAAFGAGAAADAARAVVDAAIDAWNRVVIDFHHADGIGPPDLSETISMNLAGVGFGAGTSTTIGADGKPTAGSVTINLADTDGDGLSNWWVDPTPNDNSEFLGTPLNAFTGTAQASSPAAGQFDLFSVVLAELTHNMGIANAGAATALYNTGGFTTDTGVADDAEGGGTGNFWLFQGPSVASLMTNNNGGVGGSAATFPLHTAGPRAGNVPIVFGGRTVFGVDDNANASMAAGQRTLVSNKTALIVHDAFAYDIVMPETFGTFYAVINQTTGLLTIQGGADNTVINNVNQGASSDTITVTRDGDSIVVSIDIGVDVPGTGDGFSVNDQQDAFVSVFSAGDVQSISILAADGNDTIVIGADVNVPITINDGAGNDVIDLSDSSVALTFTSGVGNDTVYGSALNDVFGSGVGNDTFYGGGGSDALTWNPGDGSDVFEGGDGNDALVFNGSGAAEVFTLSAVGTRLQLLRDVGNITMDMADVEQVNLNALGGADSATVNDLTPTDVQVVNIDLGAGSADNATVNGRAVADDLTAAAAGGVVSVTGLNYSVNVSSATTADTLTINGNDGNDSIKAVEPIEATIGIVLNGGNGDDFLSADAVLNGGDGNDTLIGGAGADTLNGNDGDDILDGRGGNNTLDGGAGANTILVSGTAAADTITTTHGAGTFDVAGGLSAGNNTISNMQLVRVEAGEGADAIRLNLLAAGGLNYTVLGGNPIGSTTGDSLRVDSTATMTVTQGPENDAGSVDAATATPTNVSYDEIELLIISGGGGVINGTNGPDAITVIARDASTHAATDGVQDFTVSVNTGPELLFIDVGALAINARSGSDEITLVAPAPNNAAWDVDVTISGGPPAVDGDRVIVQTPGAAAEAVAYTPTAADAGTLNLSSLSSLVTMSEVETLSYDGQNDSDSLTVLGGAGDDDTIVHTPGATNQAGNFAVNGLLALAYQNIGAAALLTADGLGGADTLVVNGTGVNDAFVVNGNIALNVRRPIVATGIETLTLEGLAGDDSFTLTPALPDSPFTTLNFNGGSQSSATGDRVFLVGRPNADDAIAISGQTVMIGGKAMVGSGIENIRLNAQGGKDEITYTGVVGVTDNITIASSGAAGSGQLVVPGVTLVDFLGVESFVANGNTPSASETDALAFAGTNGADLFTINMAAAGTASDPVLRLQNAAAAPPLLTLRDYTNFATLRINGLDGTDTFNVYTADSAVAPDRQILIDGGPPTAKKKTTDVLNVFYTPQRPRIIQAAETQNPQSGLIDVAYTNRRYLVQYADIENVTIQRGVVPPA